MKDHLDAIPSFVAVPLEYHRDILELHLRVDLEESGFKASPDPNHFFLEINVTLTMSDPILSDIYFINKTAWVRTSLNGYHQMARR